MSEDTSTQGASDADQGGSGEPTSGSTGDGATGGTQASEQFEAQMEALRRDFQSRQDQQMSRFEQMLAERLPAPANDGGSSTEPESMTAEDIRREAASAVFLAQQLGGAIGELQTAYPYADKGIYSDLSRFESVESLRAAAEASHQRVSALIEPAIADKEKEIRARYAERYGDLGPEEPTDTTPTGDPTIQQLSAMSQSELDRLEKDNPGVIDRVLRSAN